MTDTARDALLAELLADEDPTAEEHPDAVARLESLVDAAIAEGLAGAAAEQRALAGRLDEYGLGAAQPLLAALADVIDPTVRGLFIPARVRDAASALLAPCPCRAETVHQRGCGQAREES